MKRVIKFLPLAVMISTLSGCGHFQVPEFNETAGLTLVAYAPPTVPVFGNPSTLLDEHYQKLAEAGFTHALALYEGATSPDTSDAEANLRKRAARANQDAMQALDLCEKYGLKYYVRDWNLYGMSRTSEISYQQGINSAEQYQYAMDIIFDENCQYIHHPNYAGNYLYDEPHFHEITGMAEVASAYLDKMEDLEKNHAEPYLNLLPAYVGTAGLGPRGYDGYLRKYVETIGERVGYISYDAYPFELDSSGSSLRMLYLYCFYAAANICKEFNLDLRTYIQTTGETPYGLRDMTSTADYRFQIYNSLAFGSHYITYYQYGTKTYANEHNAGFFNLMDGTYNWSYEAIKTVNHEVKNFQDVLCAYRYDDLMLKNKDDLYPNLNFSTIAEPLASHPNVNFKAVTTDTMMTVLKHKDNQSPAFMLLNYSDPYFNETDTVTLHFPKAKGLLMYRLGQKIVVNLPLSREYTFKLGPGEGRFIIPLY